MYYFKGSHQSLRPKLRIIGKKLNYQDPLPKKGVLLLKKNNLFEYQEIKSNPAYLNWKFRVYDSDLANLSHYFINNPSTQEVWYCTSNRFDLVKINKSSPFLKFQYKKQNKYIQFLENHQFCIKNSYLDAHPLDCYIKLIRLLNMPSSIQDVGMYYLSYGAANLQINTLFYRTVNQLNKSVLAVQQIKTKTRKRVKFIEPVSKEQQIQRLEILEKWRNNLKGFEMASLGDVEECLSWVNQSSFYSQYSLKEMMDKGKPQLESYGPFIFQSKL